MASYPTFDNRWFNAGVDSDKFDEIFPPQPGEGELDPDRRRADQPGDPGPVQHRARRSSRSPPTPRWPPGCSARTSTYNDQGTYKLHVDRRTTRCAEGVRCEFRNSICPDRQRPCVYGTVNVTTALAVSSDAFFYKLGEDFYITPGTQLQDHVRQFGFGADTGIDLPFEFDGRVPTNELKAAAASTTGVLDPRRDAEPAARRPPADGHRAGPDGGHAAAARRRVRARSPTAGNVLTPHVVQADLRARDARRRARASPT